MLSLNRFMLLVVMCLFFTAAFAQTEPANPDQFKILPVTFHSFTASLEKKGVSLKWSIDTDDNFTHYIIERSKDGKSFKTLGTVNTTGSTEISHYEFTDANPPVSGIVYYRLRWEESRHTYYSSIRIVKLGIQAEADEIIAYPNPVNDQLKITLPRNWLGKKARIELYSSSGALVHKLELTSASQTEMIATASLPRGFYFLKASNGISNSEQRIIKD